MRFILTVILTIVFCMAVLATSVYLAGCANIPLQTCNIPEAVRCDGSVAERCEGGHWYPDMDCSVTSQQCIISGEGNREVVRCE